MANTVVIFVIHMIIKSLKASGTVPKVVNTTYVSNADQNQHHKNNQS